MPETRHIIVQSRLGRSRSQITQKNKTSKTASVITAPSDIARAPRPAKKRERKSSWKCRYRRASMGAGIPSRMSVAPATRSQCASAAAAKTVAGPSVNVDCISIMRLVRLTAGSVLRREVEFSFFFAWRHNTTVGRRRQGSSTVSGCTSES